MVSTITVPDGTKNHGDPNLLCLPPKWTDYFLRNELFHSCGHSSQSARADPYRKLWLTPQTPCLYRDRALSVRFAFSSCDQQFVDKIPLKQLRTQALCMIVSRHNIRAARRQDPGTWFRFQGFPEYIYKDRIILGACQFPDDLYSLIQVPPQVPFKAYHPVRLLCHPLHQELGGLQYQDPQCPPVRGAPEPLKCRRSLISPKSLSVFSNNMGNHHTL